MNCDGYRTNRVEYAIAVAMMEICKQNTWTIMKLYDFSPSLHCNDTGEFGKWVTKLNIWAMRKDQIIISNCIASFSHRVMKLKLFIGFILMIQWIYTCGLLLKCWTCINCYNYADILLPLLKTYFLLINAQSLQNE